MNINKKPVRRQHDVTTVSEVIGCRCTEFRAIQHEGSGLIELMYIKLNDVWHRFYLDAALLFWEEGSEPNADDDLTEGERYTDLCDKLGVRGVAIDEASIRHGVLEVRFANGALLELRNQPQDDGATILSLLPGHETG